MQTLLAGLTLDRAARVVIVIARIWLGGIFVVGGLRHLPILPQVTAEVAARGLPFPRLVLLLGTAFEIIAGGLLMTGLFTVETAVGLVVFTLAASVMLMNFWDKAEPVRSRFKAIWRGNLGIIAGLIALAISAWR